ncbi:MAG TPA: ester cyclase [Gaiellaceae bacterium]|nr:ester cyclase [Gaiellaceae bacterium]
MARRASNRAARARAGRRESPGRAAPAEGARGRTPTRRHGQAFRIFWDATPGTHHVEDQSAEGDKVVTRLRVVGRHEGDLPGVPRNGNELAMTATVVHRIADGKLVEKWSDKDELALLRQLGVITLPGHAGAG